MLKHVDIKYFKMAVGLDRIGKQTDVDISARCPSCSSAEKWKHSRRLHIYNKGEVTNVNCFSGDCDIHNKTMYSFLRDFFPALFDQYKRENFQHTLEGMANGETGDIFQQFTTEKPQTQPKNEIVTQDLSPYMTLIEDSPECLEYVGNRGFTYVENQHGKWYFGHQDLKIGEIIYPINKSVIIPLYYNQEMYGFYSRSIVKKSFYTYMNDVNFGFKVWNWFNIDKDQPCYIFEGIFDAKASGLTNIIALMGAKLPEERLKELKHPVFVLDNDTAGYHNSLAYAKRNMQVYVQPEEYPEKDMNALMLKNPDVSTSLLVKNNLFVGISAEVRIKSKM